MAFSVYRVGGLIDRLLLSQTSALERARGVSFERLSTGLRINRAGDDAVGLSISQRLRSQAIGLRQATLDTQAGVSVLQIMQGGAQEIVSLLQRGRELGVQAATESLSPTDRKAIDVEIQTVVATLTQIARTTTFNQISLLASEDASAPGGDGGSGEGEVSAVSSDPSIVQVAGAAAPAQAGTYAVEIVTRPERAAIQAASALPGQLNGDETLTINGVSILLADGLTRDEVVDEINQYTAQTGVVAFLGKSAPPASAKYFDDGTATSNNRLVLQTVDYGSGASLTVVSDQPVNPGTNTGFGNVPLSDTGVDGVVTIGGFATASNGLEFGGAVGSPVEGLTVELVVSPNGTAFATGNVASVTVSEDEGAGEGSSSGSLRIQIGANASEFTLIDLYDLTADGVGVADVSALSAEQAWSSIALFDAALTTATLALGQMGADQSKLERVLGHLSSATFNTTMADSRIVDADMAGELTRVTALQIREENLFTILAHVDDVRSQAMRLLTDTPFNLLPGELAANRFGWPERDQDTGSASAPPGLAWTE